MANAMRSCLGCGAPILRTRPTGEIPRYCSDACRPRCPVPGCLGHQRKRGYCSAHYGQWRALGVAGPTRHPWTRILTCIACGAPSGVQHGRRKFCSDVCRQLYARHGGNVPASAFCVHCSKPIDLADSGKGRRKRADVKLCRRCRQDLRKHGMSVEALAARDGIACGICGADVDMALRAPDWMRASVDHIVPRARRGTNDPSNLQLAHLMCNCIKSDRLVVP